MPALINISSIEDPRVEVYRDVRDRDLRGREKLFMAESELVLRRILRHPAALHSVFVTPERLASLGSELDALSAATPVYIAPEDTISTIAGFHIHRGVLAAGFRSVMTRGVESLPPPVRGTTPIYLLAEGLTNVDNVGGLFRNAAAFDVAGIILDPTCADPLYRKAIRVSMGHVLSVPFATVRGRKGETALDAWLRTLEHLRAEWGMTLIAAESGTSAGALWDAPIGGGPIGVIVGNEGIGLDPRTLDVCDAVVEIPMSDRVPSLNVSVAAGIVLYELLRRRGTSGGPESPERGLAGRCP